MIRTKVSFIPTLPTMFTIQFIDSQTGANIDGLATRKWPAVPRPGDSLVLCLHPKMRQFTVSKTTWIDPMKENGRLLIRLAVEEVV
jgi:hypothetical protein